MRANLTPQEKQSMIDMLRTLTDEMLSVLWKTITSNSGGIADMDPDLLKAFYDEFERRPGLLESMIHESKRRNTMKITKGKLKRIIREEYARLKRRGLIKESWDDRMADMAPSRPMSSYHMNLPGDDGQMAAYEEEMAEQGEDTILNMASQPGGVHIDELVDMYGEGVFEELDELEASGLLRIEDDGTIISLRGY